MIVYSYIFNRKTISPPVFAQLLASIPKPMQAKILRYRRKEDQYNCLFGKLLLRRLLVNSFGQEEHCLEQMYTNTYGKLFLKNKPAIDFNISHSGALVMCVVSDESKVGVDVERKKEVNLKDIEDFLRPEELSVFQDHLTPEIFYRFWTKKESLLKAKGVGLSTDLKDVYIHDGTGQVLDMLDELWHFQALDVPDDYLATICSECFDVILDFKPTDIFAELNTKAAMLVK